MSKIDEFYLSFEKDLEKHLLIKYPSLKDFHLLSKSLDARGIQKGEKKPRYFYRVSLIFDRAEETIEEETFAPKVLNDRPIIIGAGPAGLFCALRFVEYGIPVTLIERGKPAKERMLDIARFWRYGVLDPNSNVCYGEGGAGLYSDGKLITRIKSPYVQYVMNKFVEFGAPKETAYISNPHLGSNKIRDIISKISTRLIEAGCDIHYNQKVCAINFDKKKVCGVEFENGKKIKSPYVILATGHSAHEVYQFLAHEKVAMKAKDFAVGVRIEHKREYIDRLQYGTWVDDDQAYARLGSARYRLSYQNKVTDKGSYSFCMCPGGYVLSSGTQENGIVVNGMSNYSRASRWSNSALVVTVKNGEDFKLDHILDGLSFQRKIEENAFLDSKTYASGRELPCLTVDDFLNNKIGKKALPKTSTPSGIYHCELFNLLPTFIVEHLQKALFEFDKKMKGFNQGEAILMAPETRTSAPVTIERDMSSLESTSHSGLYPAGEGAGYAGGITSAAVDGVKIAESILKNQR